MRNPNATMQTSVGKRPMFGMRPRSLSPRRSSGRNSGHHHSGNKSYLSQADIRRFASQQQTKTTQNSTQQQQQNRFHHHQMQQQQMQQMREMMMMRRAQEAQETQNQRQAQQGKQFHRAKQMQQMREQREQQQQRQQKQASRISNVAMQNRNMMEQRRAFEQQRQKQRVAETMAQACPCPYHTRLREEQQQKTQQMQAEQEALFPQHQQPQQHQQQRSVRAPSTVVRMSKPTQPQPQAQQQQEQRKQQVSPAAAKEETELQRMARELNARVEDDVFDGVEWFSDETIVLTDESNLTISASGYYQIERDMILDAQPIVVATSNVVVDLNGQTLRTQNKNAAIIVAESSKNVMVANGVIECHGDALTANGVHAEANTENITVRDLTVRDFTESGLSSNGTTGLLVDKVHLESSRGTFGVQLSNTRDAIVSHTHVSVSNARGAVCGASVQKCTNVVLGPRTRVQNATGTSTNGILVDGSTNVLFSGVRIVSVTGTEGTAYGVNVSKFSHDVQIKNVRVDRISTRQIGKEQQQQQRQQQQQQEAYGVYVDETSSIVPSTLSGVHVREVKSGVSSHHIVIDGRVVDKNAPDMSEVSMSEVSEAV